MSNMSSGLALSVFRNACGLSAPLALVCQDVSSSAGAYTPLDYPRPFMLIGRLPTADLCLNREDVSRRHTFLQAIEGRVYWHRPREPYKDILAGEGRCPVTGLA